MIKRLILIAVVFAVLLMLMPIGALVPIEAQAQSTTAAPTPQPTTQIDVENDYYNNAAGWHAPIPPGWTNDSTPDYAHFTNGAQAVFVFGYENVTAGDAVSSALAAANLTFTSPPVDTRDVNLINGTWIQQVYVENGQIVVAHTQNFDGTQYVTLFVGTDAAVPLIVMRDGAADNASLVADGISEAAHLIDAAPGDVASAPAQNTDTSTTVTVMSFADGLTATGYPRGSAVYTVVGHGDAAALNAAAGYFNTLTVFFITPRTAPYLYLGLTVAGVIFVLLIASLYLRYRNLLKDEATLRQLDAS